MRGILPLMKLFLTNFWKSMQGTDCVFAWSHLKEGPWLALVGSICRHQRRGMRADPLQGYGTKEECREGSRGPGGGGGGRPCAGPFLQRVGAPGSPSHLFPNSETWFHPLQPPFLRTFHRIPRDVRRPDSAPPETVFYLGDLGHVTECSGP